MSSGLSNIVPLKERFERIYKKTGQAISVWGNYTLAKWSYFDLISAKRLDIHYSMTPEEMQNYTYFNSRESTIYNIVSGGVDEGLDIIVEFKKSIDPLEPIGDLKMSLDLIENLYLKFIEMKEKINKRFLMERKFIQSKFKTWDIFLEAEKLFLKEIEEFATILIDVRKDVLDRVSATSKKILSVSGRLAYPIIPGVAGGVLGGLAGLFGTIGSKIFISSSLPVKETTLALAAIGAVAGYIYGIAISFSDIRESWRKIDIKTAYNTIERSRKT